MTLLFIVLLALLLILVLTALIRFNPFLSLLSVSLFVALMAGKPFEGIQAILAGMERVIYQFGLIIVCGSIIGLILDGIGGTAVIADDMIRLSKEPVLALNLLGFLVAIPVMCCILAYVIFIPVARAIAAKLRIPTGVAATSLSLGTLASYELIYPVPGIYSAAIELGIPGRDIVLLGLSIAIPTSLVGYLYAKRFCRLGPIPPDVVATGGKRTSRLRAYPPLIGPLLLIFSNIIYPIPLLNFVGDPNVALLIGVFLVLVAAQGSGRDTINTWTKEAVKKGGGILMVLCAGGALASTLAVTEVGLEIGKMIIQSGVPALLVPFLVAGAIQTVQGSRLVTFLIAPSIIQPLLPELGLPLELVLMSMGAGTFLVSHANDAYFWTVIELADMTPAAGYRCYTIGGIVLGAVAFLMTALIYLVGYA